MTSAPQDGRAKLYLEDLAVGQKFITRARTLDAAEIKAFAADFDPQPFHLDEAAAEKSFFGGLAASGWHTASITMRLVVETLPLAGGVIGAGGELQWPKPTRPGDTLHAEIEVLSINPSQSRAGRGTAMIGITTRNQHGEVVQTFNVKTLLVGRNAAGGA